MTNRRLASKPVAGSGLSRMILPQVTYGLMTTRMAIMALIMGGGETAAAGRRA
jgi:hypothetical protein